jgi:Protein of unknown function (DUF2798)
MACRLLRVPRYSTDEMRLQASSHMLGIPRRYSHFIYAVLQSGITTSIASMIASVPFIGDHTFLEHWIGAWGASWMVMLPVVIFAAPLLRRLTLVLTTED